MAASIAVWAADAEPAPARVVLPVGAGGGAAGLGAAGATAAARCGGRALADQGGELLLGRGEFGLQLRLLGAEGGCLRAGGDLGVLRDLRAPLSPAP